MSTESIAKPTIRARTIVRAAVAGVLLALFGLAACRPGGGQPELPTLAPAAAESQPAAAESQPAAAESQPATAESQPAATMETAPTIETAPAATAVLALSSPVASAPAAALPASPAEAAEEESPSTADSASLVRTLFIGSLGYALQPAGAAEPGINDVAVFPAAVPAGQPALWVAHTVGLRDFMAEQTHRVAIYSEQETGPVQIAALGLAAGSGDPLASSSPDYLSPGGVSQVLVEPGSVWLAVEGGVGAHGGAFSLLRFDGSTLSAEFSAQSDSPGVGQVRDLNGDGAGEVVVDATDNYVFCYACGVRMPTYVVWRLDGDRFVQVLAEPLPPGAPEPAIEANDRLLHLALAQRWGELATALDAAEAFVADDPSGTLAWNRILLRLNEEARRALLSAPSAYPLLDHVFYGDFAGAVDQLRAYAPEQVFSRAAPALVGAVAEGWEESLALRIDQVASSALDYDANDAAAHFLRAWAHFLTGGLDLAAEEARRAAELAPDDSFYAASHAFLQSTFQGATPRLTALEPLTLRSGPGSAYPEAGALAAGDFITVTGFWGGDGAERWWQVAFAQQGQERAWAPASAAVEVRDAQGVGEVLPPALLSPIAERGRIYFSAPDAAGVTSIFSIDVVAGAAANLVIGEARAPALQPQGEVVAFSSLRSDMYGLGGLNLRTGERLRYTYNLEDTQPRWYPAGDRVLFSSTREGDRKPRVYSTWADGSGSVETLGAGQDADLHPNALNVVYKGCDEQGTGCGLWIMEQDGAAAHALTTVDGDARPRWSPSGDAVVFMSEARDGNWELYLAAVDSGEVTRLTNEPALDGLPAFSPDGSQVAFVSNRSGSWEILLLAVEGEQTPAAPVTLHHIGPDLPDWLEQGLDWSR